MKTKTDLQDETVRFIALRTDHRPVTSGRLVEQNSSSKVKNSSCSRHSQKISAAYPCIYNIDEFTIIYTMKVNYLAQECT